MAASVSFDALVGSLSDLGRMAREDAQMAERIQAVVAGLHELGAPSVEKLAAFIKENPHAVPILTTCIGLTQEQFKNLLSHRMGTAGWIRLARTRPGELIAMLEQDFELIRKLGEQLDRDWTLADVLLERYLWSRRGAASAVSQGRSVEDEVERVVLRLGLPMEPRTQFLGKGGESAPCDLAIPAGGLHTQIAIAMKGYNSTGSKLSDAVREVDRMVNVRTPRMYVYVIVDGIGWRSRKADLRRIYNFWERKEIEGLYTLAQLDEFERELRIAAVRASLLEST